jgi:hypothetical protein
MNLRRRFKHTQSLDQRLSEKAVTLREQAADAAPGISRERLIRMARQVETVSQLSEWLGPPGREPPT